MTPKDFEPGQRVLVALRSHRHGIEDGRRYEGTVKTIGKRWVVLDDGHRFDPREGMELDGGQYSSPGRVYLSQSHFENERAREATWRAIQNIARNSHRAPPHMSLTALADALLAMRGPGDGEP